MFNPSRYSTLFLILMLGTFLLSSGITAHAQSLARISGTVIDHATGNPVAGAQVFIEQGLTLPIEMITADARGRYDFPDVLLGMISVFAYADGYAFGGFSIQANSGGIYENQIIPLKPPSTISGSVSEMRGKAVSDALVTRILLVDGDARNPDSRKASIPFTKIQRYGFQVPATDSRGRFVINLLPQGETGYIKIDHPKFAQQVASEISIGSSNTEIEVTPGVMVSGTVLTRDSRSPVPNAPIVFRNSLPPRDTTITQAGSDGVYLLRLRPGAYTYESFGSTYATVNKPQIVVTGERLTQQIDLTVAGKGSIHGKVMDAVTGDGVPDAQLVLETDGFAYKIESTDANGEYFFDAPEGQCTIRYWRAGGYLPPPTAGFALALESGQSESVPTFWLKAVPSYSLEIVDADEESVPGALVQILQPEQIGWRVADENGLVVIAMAVVPENGVVIGLVDHPENKTGALFMIDASRAEDAIVQLMPLRSVQGRVTDENGKALAGKLVSGDVGHASLTEPVPVWKTITNTDGEFRYSGVVDGLTMLYSVFAQDPTDSIPVTPTLYAATGPDPAIVPTLTLSAGESESTLIGDRFSWRRYRKVDGSGARAESNDFQTQVVVFAKSARAAMLLDSLEIAQEYLNPLRKQFVLIVDDPSGLSSEHIPIHTGTSPTSAEIYIVVDETVIAETTGFPTYAMVRDSASQP